MIEKKNHSIHKQTWKPTQTELKNKQLDKLFLEN